MNITLAPELEKFVQAQLESGAYHSASELFGDALFLLAEKEMKLQKSKQAMNDFIQVGLDSAKNGKLYSPEELEEDIEQLFIELRQKNA